MPRSSISSMKLLAAINPPSSYLTYLTFVCRSVAFPSYSNSFRSFTLVGTNYPLYRSHRCCSSSPRLWFRNKPRSAMAEHKVPPAISEGHNLITKEHDGILETVEKSPGHLTPQEWSVQEGKSKVHRLRGPEALTTFSSAKLFSR